MQPVKFKVDRSRFCGKGAYGVVYPGHLQSPEDCDIAVKCITIPSESDACASLQVAREMHALRAFSHPHLLAVKGVAYQSPTPGSVLGLITSHYDMSLAILAKANDGIATVVRQFVFSSVASALHHLHAAGCVHCDVKPQNILISPAKQQCVLGDLGLIQPAGSKDQEPYVVTSWYRPPELLFETSEYYGSTVDIWSLGCILVEMIAQRPLFASLPEQTTVAMHISNAFALPAFPRYRDLCTIVQQHTLKLWMQNHIFTVHAAPTTQEWMWIQQTLMFDASRRCTARDLLTSEAHHVPEPPRNIAREFADLAVDPAKALQTEISKVPRWVEVT